MTQGALIHVGSDVVMVYTEKESLTLKRKNLEQTLPLVLHTLHITEHTDVRVIQGPGSFLNIRVGILLLNARQSITHGALIFHTIHKDALFQWLYDEGYTPQHTVMSIGQRKNARRYDHKQKSYETIRCTDREKIQQPYLVDQTDDVYVVGDMIERGWSGKPHARWGGEHISLAGAPREQTMYLIPYYGMDPLTH